MIKTKLGRSSILKGGGDLSEKDASCSFFYPKKRHSHNCNFLLAILCIFWITEMRKKMPGQVVRDQWILID